ncbi:hypothetical protein M231_04809 [Tremella mesenterica]|uniref:Uncharacterized protein n=1 Tax=Tremella mesenterica TaxID=5217 RepID=A0A4Q1BJX6_TREME|nr:hypothetical protein M231_04809 [Tremella mesenterica]
MATMDEDIIVDPYKTRNSLSLTPPQIGILFLGCLSLLTAQMDVPPPLQDALGSFRRMMVILVAALVLYHFFDQMMTAWKSKLEELPSADRKALEKMKEKGMKDTGKPDPWENESSHPSAFLTTREAKPRLFPFPLGKAGTDEKLKGELWWEAGNSAHVGHYNQAELPENKAKMKKEAKKAEELRLKKHQKEIKEYTSNKKKWAKRLVHVKLVVGIIAIGLFHRGAAVLCLAALIWFVLATELGGMFDPKIDEDVEPSFKKPQIPTTPGLGLTYIYEPSKGGVAPTGAFPLRAPTNRLLTSLDNRYAS